MDVGALIRENAAPLGRFLLRQLRLWVAVVRDPLKVVSEAGIETDEALPPALGLAFFAYLLFVLFDLPMQFRLDGMQASDIDVLVVLVDFALTLVCFVLVGVCLFVAGWLLGGRGGLYPAFVAGLYLSAYWPLVKLADYLLFVDLSRLPLSEDEAAVAHAILASAVVLGVLVALTAKAAPVMAHVHGFGRWRAAAATVLQLVLIAFATLLVLEHWFAAPAGSG